MQGSLKQSLVTAGFVSRSHELFEEHSTALKLVPLPQVAEH